MDQQTTTLFEEAYSRCLAQAKRRASPRDRIDAPDLQKEVARLYQAWRDPQIYAQQRALRAEIGRHLHRRQRTRGPSRRQHWLGDLAAAAYQELLHYRVVWEYPNRSPQLRHWVCAALAAIWWLHQEESGATFYPEYTSADVQSFLQAKMARPLRAQLQIMCGQQPLPGF